MAYHVELSREAEADILEAFVWKGEQSFEVATRWYSGLMDAIYSLEDFPTRCPIAPDNEAFEEEVRQLLYGKRRDTYRILFAIRGEVIYVSHVRHGARRWVGEDEKD